MRDLKEDAIFCCGIDGKELKLVMGKHSLYYRCPNYEKEEREEEDEVCMNRLSLKDLDILYAELEQMRFDRRIKPGEHGRKIHLVYEIAEVNPFYIKVYVVNTLKVNLAERGYVD